MKRFALLIALLVLLAVLTGCGEPKTVSCDHCGATIELTKDSNITDEWIVFCKTCEEELFGDNPVVSPE